MRLPGWLDATETPDSEDAAHIIRYYSGLYAGWKIHDMVYWDEATIPDEVFMPIVRMVVDQVAPSFDNAAPVEFDIVSGRQVSMGRKGWEEFRRIVTRPQSGKTTNARADYF
jgi:hypothetical protein